MLGPDVDVGEGGFSRFPQRHRTPGHSVYVPTHFSHGVFEASTGYLPKESSLALYFDHADNTSHFRQAIRSRRVFSGSSAKRTRLRKMFFSRCANWNCVFRETDVKRGGYTCRCLLALGSVAELQKTLWRLSQHRQD